MYTIQDNTDICQLALFIVAWAGLWTFVSGFIYTADNPKDLEFERTYTEDGYDSKNVTFVIFEDQVRFLLLLLYFPSRER